MRPPFFAIVLSLAACAPGLKRIEPEVRVTGLDFREHTREGFLFSPNAYPGDFESIGVVAVAVFAEGERVTGGASFAGGPSTTWRFIPVDAQGALTEARKRATALGANALVNVQVRDVAKAVGLVSVPGVEVSGFAIKRAK